MITTELLTTTKRTTCSLTVKEDCDSVKLISFKLSHTHNLSNGREIETRPHHLSTKVVIHKLYISFTKSSIGTRNVWTDWGCSFAIAWSFINEKTKLTIIKRKNSSWLRDRCIINQNPVSIENIIKLSSRDECMTKLKLKLISSKTQSS